MKTSRIKPRGPGGRMVLIGMLLSWISFAGGRSIAQEIKRPEVDLKQDGRPATEPADVLAVAGRVVDATKAKWRHAFVRFEREWEAAEAVREAEKERTRTLNELHKRDAKASEKLRLEFDEYGRNYEEARSEKVMAKLMRTADSVPLRTTAGDVRVAEAKLDAARKALPAGEGAAYNALKEYHGKLIASCDLRDRFDEEDMIQTHYLVIARQEWLRVKGPLKAGLEKVIEPWEEELHRLRAEAEAAKRAEANKQDGELPEEKRWPAAKRRYEECLARELDSAAAVDR